MNLSLSHLVLFVQCKKAIYCNVQTVNEIFTSQWRQARCARVKGNLAISKSLFQYYFSTLFMLFIVVACCLHVYTGNNLRT